MQSQHLPAGKIWKYMKSIQSDFTHPEDMMDLLIHDLSFLGNRAWNLHRSGIHFFSDTDEKYRSSSEIRTAIAARRLVAELNEGSYTNNQEQKERNKDFISEQFPCQRMERLIACLQRESVFTLIDEKSEVTTLLAHFFRCKPDNALDLPSALLTKLYPPPSTLEMEEKSFLSLQAEPSVKTEQLLALLLQDLRAILIKHENPNAIRNFIAAHMLFSELNSSQPLCENSLILSLHSEPVIFFIDEDSQVARLVANFMRRIPYRMIDLPAEIFKKLYPTHSKLRPVQKETKEEAKPIATISEVKEPIRDHKADSKQFMELVTTFDTESDKADEMITLLKASSPHLLTEKLDKLYEFFPKYIAEIKAEKPQAKQHILFLNNLFKDVLAGNFKKFSSATILTLVNFLNELLFIPATFHLAAFALERIASTSSVSNFVELIAESFLQLNLNCSPLDGDLEHANSINNLIKSMQFISWYLNPDTRERVAKKLFELMDNNLKHIDQYYKKDSTYFLDGDALTQSYYHNFYYICTSLSRITGQNISKETRDEFVERIFELTKHYHIFLVEYALNCLEFSLPEATRLSSILRNKEMNDGKRNTLLASLAKIIQEKVSYQYQSSKLNLHEGEEKTFPDDKSDDVARIIWSYVSSEPLPLELKRR